MYVYIYVKHIHIISKKVHTTQFTHTHTQNLCARALDR